MRRRAVWTAMSFCVVSSPAGSAAVAVDPERRTQIPCAFFLPILQRNAGGIGDFHNRIERGNRPGGIHEARVSHGSSRRAPCLGETAGATAEGGLHQHRELDSSGHAGVTALGDAGQIIFRSSCFAALTEQGRVTGGSIKTTIECRGAPSDQLNLRMGNGAIFVGEISDFLILQIEFHVEIEEIEDFLRNEA